MISNYASNIILKNMLGKGSQYFSFVTRAFLALSSTEPQANGQGVTEPVGNGYVRKQLGYYQDTYGQLMGNPENGVIKNSQEIHFNKATGDWGQQRYACIYDAATGGNLIAWGELATPITPVENTVPVIAVDGLVISIV